MHIIWMANVDGSGLTSYQSPLLTPQGDPPFGANGLGFNKAGDTLFVANTSNDTIVKIPVDPSSGLPDPSKAAVFVNGINGPDGLVLDSHDNLWVSANQADEIVAVNPDGMVIAKLADSSGVDQKGLPHGLLFPASLAFSANGNFFYVTNLALDLLLLNPDPAYPGSVDSAWAAQVKTYTVSRIKVRIPPHGHGQQ
jgi:sugar lactone lactonase YvrE